MMRILIALCVCVLAIGGWRPAPCVAQADAQAEPPPAAPTADIESDDLRYTVVFEGLSEVGLEDRFKSVSTLWAGRKQPASTRAQIGRRLREDEKLANRLLRAEGYFAALVSSDAQEDAARGQIIARIIVDAGLQYSFSSVTVEAPEAQRSLITQVLGFASGEPVSMEKIQDGERRILSELPRRGYPFVSIGQRQIVIDHATATGTLLLPVDPGPGSVFGELLFEGDLTVSARHMSRLARFKSGAQFDQRELDDFREALLLTGLFAEVRITPRLAAGRDAEGADKTPVDVVVTTRPARQRTIGLGLGYATGEGIKADIDWQHRNLFGHEERLSLNAAVGTIEQSLLSSLEFLNFRRRDQSLQLTADLRREEPNAFSATSAIGGITFVRQKGPIWQKEWITSIGAELGVTRTRDAQGRRTFVLASLPLSVRYDGTDDLFNPTSGFRAFTVTAGDIAREGGVFGYLRAEAGASAYQSLDAQSRIVLAQRIRVGSIIGARNERIPATRRFFAGGGGSVRGFGFQAVGPTDVNGDPAGGRSLLELSSELRYRFTDRFGVVPFVDAGNVYRGATPKVDDLRIGVGVGLRYYTDFAPIRVDFATPIDRKTGEPKVGLYVSIGQSF